MLRIILAAGAVASLVAPAWAIPNDDRDQIAQRAAMEAAMEAVTTELLKPGPVRKDWSQGGIDVYALLKATPGGFARNYLLSIDKDGQRSLEIVDVARSASPVPGTWTRIIHAGDPQPEVASLTVVGMSGPFFMVGWDGRRRVGDAFCTRPAIGGELHESAAISTASEIPTHLVPTVFKSMVRRVKDVRICWRFDRQGAGYAVSYFFDDGRTIPAMNEAREQVEIVPAAPLEELLAPPSDQD